MNVQQQMIVYGSESRGRSEKELKGNFHKPQPTAT
jgi:hypothetical protein